VRWLGVVAVAAVLIGLAATWLLTPPERVLDESIRILYVHVGAAVMGYVAYLLTALGALMFLWRRDGRWDRRLTLTLVLWFIYAGYLLLRHYTAGDARALLSALLACLGLPLMVLNHFAVTLYRTYHPEPILVRPGGPAVDAVYVQLTFLSLAVYALVFVALLAARLRLAARVSAWEERAPEIG
jgi:heme exporter protein C